MSPNSIATAIKIRKKKMLKKIHRTLPSSLSFASVAPSHVVQLLTVYNQASFASD